MLIPLVTSLFVGLAVPAQAGVVTQPEPLAIVVAAEGETQELLLKDGTRAIGRVEHVDDGHFTFRTTAGVVMEVNTGQVEALGPVGGRVVGGEFWPVDSNPTRLFFGPTGRTLKRGESYLAVYEVFLPFVQYGVTDRFTIGAGAPLIFAGGSDTPFWITPKVQVFKRESTEASVGLLQFLNVGNGSVGIAYGVVTKGGADAAISVGAGYAFSHFSGDGDDNGTSGNEFGSGSGGAPVLMVAGERRVTRRVKVITENYIVRGGTLVSAGVRFLGERLTADLGMATPLGVDGFVAVPVINFVWKFQ